ncbi:hypothetical protein HB780_05560 (plasmid) [Rhizobium lusitanum]|uniref:hypothetical protein n=1 Tax=Rhizobium lusitanum TaxID=293958 RepID=UPI001621AA06|nr:hypothetical protein [Rhizobium lusitanum]QND45222.1 hypothetical protein HB780_05560 [Rhizobium lusitanum]
MDNVYPLLGVQRPQPLLIDHNGREMKLFVYSYRYADKEWSIELWAWSRRDAKRRVRAMRRSLRLDGMVHCNDVPLAAVVHP